MADGTLTIFSAGAVQGVVEQVAAAFERTAGCRLIMSFNTVGATRDKLAAGEAADLGLVSAPVADGLLASGTLVAGSVRPLGRVGMGLTVPEGASAPRIDTVEAFCAALRQARSVAYTDPAAGGTGGIYFSKLLERLDLARVVAPKAVLAKGGHDVAGRVARREAAIGITIISEIAAVPGAVLGAPLPAELQNYTTYVAGVPATAQNRAAAERFVEALRGPDTVALWRAAGFEPAA